MCAIIMFCVQITAMGHAKIGDFGLIAPYTRSPSALSPRGSSGNGTGGFLSPTPDHRSWLEEESSGLFPIAPAKTTAPAATRTAEIHKSGSLFQEIWEAGSDSSLFQPLSFDTHTAAPSHPLPPNQPRRLRSLVGNYNYAPPEMVLRKGYDHSVDWWAVAVLCFHFLAGCTPFESDSQEQTMDNIVSGAIHWSALPTHISDECKHFIASIITCFQPEDRLGYHSSEEVLAHPFFRDVNFMTLYQGYGPVHPQLRPSMKQGGRAMSQSQSQSQSFSASFVESEGPELEDLDVFTSVNSELEASDLAQLMAMECSAEPTQDKAVDESFDFVDFDCLYA